MKPKLIFKEAPLLLFLFVIIWIIVFCLTGTLRLSHEFSINLHDTYFVIAWSKLIILPYLLLVSIVYLIREAFFKYRRLVQNTILLSVLSITLIILLKLNELIINLAPLAAGWTIYPPLSGLPRQNALPTSPSPLIMTASHILFYFQILLILILVIIAVLTGKNFKSINEKK